MKSNCCQAPVRRFIPPDGDPSPAYYWCEACGKACDERFCKECRGSGIKYVTYEMLVGGAIKSHTEGITCSCQFPGNAPLPDNAGIKPGDVTRQDQAAIAFAKLADPVGQNNEQRVTGETSPVKTLIALCREVMAAHGDVRSAEYNGCEIDGEACFWCEQARNAIAEIEKNKP